MNRHFHLVPLSMVLTGLALATPPDTHRIDPVPAKQLSLIEPERSGLLDYLDIEFRGRYAPADSMRGERKLSKGGLVEIYGDSVDRIIRQMEELLLKTCATKETHSNEVHALSSVLFNAFVQPVMDDEQKRNAQTELAVKELEKEQSAPLRRLALIAFMIRENVERRLRRIAASKIPNKYATALGAFRSEFGENFAQDYEEKDSHERLRLRSQGARGIDLLEKYQSLMDTVDIGIEQRRAEFPRGGKDAYAVIGALQDSYKDAALNGCSDGSTAAPAALKYYTGVLGSLNWTEHNRGMVLDAILGQHEMPKPDPHEINHALNEKLEMEHIEMKFPMNRSLKELRNMELLSR